MPAPIGYEDSDVVLHTEMDVLLFQHTAEIWENCPYCNPKYVNLGRQTDDMPRI